MQENYPSPNSGSGTLAISFAVNHSTQVKPTIFPERTYDLALDSLLSVFDDVSNLLYAMDCSFVLEINGLRYRTLEAELSIFLESFQELVRFANTPSKDGYTFEFYEQGIHYRFEFRKTAMGQSNGIWKEYYESGKLKEVGEYKLGEYFPIEFWDEKGRKLLNKGCGKRIEKFGHSELEIVEQYYENGQFIKEVKVSSAVYSTFIPNKSGSESD